ERVGLTDAADVGGDGAAGPPRGVDGEVGHVRIEAAEVLDRETVQRFGGERGDRDVHVLDGFLALARRYRHRAQRGRVRPGGRFRRGLYGGVLRSEERRVG